MTPPRPDAGREFESDGRGILLIHQLMDEVRFERGGTEIPLWTHPPAAPQA